VRDLDKPISVSAYQLQKGLARADERQFAHN